MKKRYDIQNYGELLQYFLPEGEEGKYDEFNTLCTSLCEAMGLKVRRRPKPDGSGMKIELVFGEEKGTILCLCYRPDISVQRSDLVRFVKDNMEMDARNMIVMTTSTFSPGALAYSQGTGIRAVNGEQVVGLMKKHGFIMEHVVKPVEPEPEIHDLREKRRPVVKQQQAEEAPPVVAKSPLAARQSVQSHKPRSQGFDMRSYLKSNKQVKPFR